MREACLNPGILFCTLTTNIASLCCIFMRTTIVIKDELLAEAKKRAADRKSSVSAVINEALSQAFHSTNHPEADPHFQLPTYRPGAAEPVRSTPDDFHELEVAEEMKPYDS